MRSEDSGYFVAVLADEEEFPSGAFAFNIMILVDKDEIKAGCVFKT
ncbi:MAG: hypothetical protein VX100_02925 [Pseudomonadota bacterium]|nr:hypothetical protein [Pseudomonadota bacterium]